LSTTFTCIITDELSTAGFLFVNYSRPEFMSSNTNFDAHLSALLFLGSAGLLAVLLVGILITALWLRHSLRYAVTALAVLVIGYGGLLLAFSLLSRARTLARGEEKYFCELDCHLAYSVRQVERAKIIGNTTASGEFYVVAVRARFDETTAAPWRPRNVPLTPDPLDFAVIDDEGRRVPRSPAGQSAWDALHGTPTSLLEPLLPGEFYDLTLVFDIPAEVRSPRLLASFAVFPTQVLIGDENSVLHKKTYFCL
jgi:hypothetical protein